MLQVHAAQGSHPKAHPARSYSIVLHACVPPVAVTVNGQPVHKVHAEAVVSTLGRNTWHYDGSQLAVVINLFERFTVTADVVVQLVMTPGKQASLRPKMVSARGLIARARLLKPKLDNMYPRAYPV